MLKNLYFWIFCFFMPAKSLLSQVAPPAHSQGIDFQNSDLSTVFNMAKAQKKPLFIEIHLNGCPHCEALAPVLAEKEVGEFYNHNFVSWKAEANSEGSKALQKMKGITYPEFPILFYFDPEGNLMHMATPAEKHKRQEFIEEVIGNGQNAMNPKEQTSKYAERFAAGDRSLQFLVNYGKYVKAIKDELQLNKINEAFASQLISPQDKISQTGFYVLQRFVNDFNSPLAVYFFAHLPNFRAKYPAKDVKEAGESVIFHSLFGSKADTYKPDEVVGMREQMVVLGVPATEAASRTLIKEMDAHLRAKDTKAAVQVFNTYRKISTTVDLAYYAYMLKYFNEKAVDNSYLSEMPGWAEAGLKMAKPHEKESKIAADLYYELAEVYTKAGQNQLASETAANGLRIARAVKMDLSRHETQVERLKKEH